MHVGVIVPIALLEDAVRGEHLQQLDLAEQPPAEGVLDHQQIGKQCTPKPSRMSSHSSSWWMRGGDRLLAGGHMKRCRLEGQLRAGDS